MAQYAKPPRRTEQRGLRPYSGTGAEPFSAKEIQKMGERIERILADSSQHSEEEKFLLSQVRSIYLFREAKNDLRSRDRLIRKINRGEKRGQQLGFSQEDLRSLNRWVLDQDLAGNLETLRKKVERKTA